MGYTSWCNRTFKLFFAEYNPLTQFLGSVAFKASNIRESFLKGLSNKISDI